MDEILAPREQQIRIPAAAAFLDADLRVPRDPGGVILFAHGSGSGRFSPRNRSVAQALNAAGFATVLADLLTPDEETADRRTGRLRFDIPFLAARLRAVAAWSRRAGPAATTAGLFRREHRGRGRAGRGCGRAGSGRCGRVARRPARHGGRGPAARAGADAAARGQP
jgi:dienelactone hydrolase